MSPLVHPMSMIRRLLIVILILPALAVAAQEVDAIKSASKSSSSSSRSSDENNSSNGGGGILFDIITFIPHWQSFKLHDDNKLRYPPTISLDGMFQGAFKPSDTYILWPRIRGNWGLFSTDFRVNYMVEKTDAGVTDLRTNDWQILQLNIITSRFITARIGFGTMVEAFGNRKEYTEGTLGFGIHAPDHSNAFFMEYREAFQSNADVTARIEFSANYQHQIFRTGALHGYVSAGVVYQKYYGTIDFWGLQAGVVFRVFKHRE